MRTLLRLSAAALSLLLLLMFLIGGTVAADGSYTINGVTVRYGNVSSSHNGCWSYVYNFYYKIWGIRMNSNFYGDDNILRDYSAKELTLTPEHLKEYVSMAKPGAALRICNSEYLHGSDGMGHSLLIVSITEDGFTTFEGGLSAAPHCREHFYTWEEFCETGWLGKRYGYIKYIKQPGETAPEDLETEASGEVEMSGVLEEVPTLGALEDPTQAVEPETPEPEIEGLGDLDGNGRLEVMDYMLLKRFVGGTVRLTKAQKQRADLNGDGVVDLQDYLLLKEFVLGAE